MRGPISRDDAKRIIDNIDTFCAGWRDYAKEQIDNLPTADKVGKWILDENPHDGDCRCSVCHVAIHQMHERNHGLLNALTGGKWWTFYNFCPKCGARMKGEEDE